jgi:hypothetical protein
VDRPLSLKNLRRALKAFGVQETPSRGKGSHTYFHKVIDDAEVGYPIPTNNDPVLIAYVKGARRKFKLTEEDGVSDKDFYDNT